VARGADGAARGGEGTHPARRRAGEAAARAAVGPDRQDVQVRHRRRQCLAGRPLQGAFAADDLPLHARARLQGGLSVLLGDRGRVQRIRHSPAESRRLVLRRFAGAAGQGAGLQEADGLELSVGVVVRRRLQLRLRRRRHRGATAVARRRIQLHGSGREGGRGFGRRNHRLGDRRRRRCRLADVLSRAARHEHVRARRRRRLSHVLGLRARAGRPVGHVPVARPRAARAQRIRSRTLVAAS